ncbi:thioredoxin domain-containing protein [Emticicia sp. CRIBPO]|uniref:vitamin K epoxide reductase family protein n=1 Tax=Emticicia sp. CRIBPO TaxID=2683258 RepID=UPI0014133E6E|nr:vitamin K epoxide reductase family protein [Emticicia sp. CRIBPO]NBA88716.1 thioredoxin domain-containing protein [Emticicia sp. CRIBPO]
MKDNFQYTFTSFLRLIKARVTTTSAISYLESHPDQESMWAYSQALSQFKIENIGIKASIENIETLPTPFITYFEKNGGTFLTVKSTGNGTVEWLDTQKGWIKSQYSDFIRDWSGIVLLAEVDEKSGEKNYLEKKRLQDLQNLRIPAALSILIISLLLFITPDLIGHHYIEISILILIKTAGMFLSSMLFVKSINGNSILLNKLCSSNSNLNCQSILDSPAAKITHWLSWSDMGFIYFFGSFFSLSMLLSSGNGLNNYFVFQSIISVLSLVFCIYSIYYQSIIANSWCTLCLGVAAIFIIEFLILLFFPFQFKLNFEFIRTLCVGFNIPIIFLLLFKKPLLDSIENSQNKKELAKIKSNPNIFKALMVNQKDLPAIPAEMTTIMIGNPQAKHTLTIVSNPLCTPCAKMHQKIENLVQENNHINCQVIFLSNTDDNNEGGKFLRKLFSLPTHLQHKAVEEWFARKDKNYEAWNVNYSEHILNNNSFTLQNTHNQWIINNGIKSTPSLFIDKKILPRVISIDDLGSYLSHLNENTPVT